MPRPFTRILSDVHYGDHASVVTDLRQLDPLLAGAAAVVFNGDTIDSRPHPQAGLVERLKADVAAWLHGRSATLLTGNHDPEITDLHHLDLADGAVFVTHGDIVFDDIVPWSIDVALVRSLVAQERAALAKLTFSDLLLAHRRAGWRIPRRLQTDVPPLQAFGNFLADTVWPPLRIPRILRAWAQLPARLAAFAAAHRPQARCLIAGHTHHPGVWRRPDGRVVINTGSYCRPFGRLVVDITADQVIVRRVQRRGLEFSPGAVITEIALAPAGNSPRSAP